MDRAGAPREHPPPWVVDVLLGTAVTLAIAVIVAAAQGRGDPPDVGAYLFAIGFGALIGARRRVPRLMLVLTVLGLFAYYALDYPPIGVAVPVVAALACAADAGRTGWAIGAGAVVLAVSIYFRLTEGEPAGLILGYETVSSSASLCAAIALGYSLRARRRAAASQAELTRLTVAAAEADSELRMQNERERISRDLHDTVGHTMAVISLQAGVAAEAVEPGNAAARDALERIREASGTTLRDLRTMVKVLRSTDGTRPDGAGASGVLSLSAVPDLADAARAAGIDVRTEIAVAVADLVPVVDSTAFRIVQEAVTNMLRHSGARSALIAAHLVDDVLHVEVSDDGRGAPDPTATTPAGTARAGTTQGGYGLAGLAERVRLLGGTMSIHSDDGFALRARIPSRP